MHTSFFATQLLADAFCERHTLSVFDEPLNLATNLALIGAAVALSRIALQGRRAGAIVPISMQALIGLAFLMSFASVVFHAWPSPWSEAFDQSSVHAFVLYLGICVLHWMLGWKWSHALLLLPPVVALVVALRTLLPESFATLLAMLPALLGCVAFAVGLARRDDPRWRNFAAASATFAVALVFHRVDRPLCHLLPTGTHFLWHAFSGLTAYIAAATVLREALGNAADTVRPLVPVRVKRDD